MTERLEMPVEQFAEAVANENARLIKRNEQLVSGPGGIMEMKQTIVDREADIAAWKGIHEGAVLAMQSEINNLRSENDRFRDIISRMSRIYKHLNPERHPGVYFIHGSLGSYDDNGMPEKLLVVPAYGVDFSYIYERTGKTTGPEW